MHLITKAALVFAALSLAACNNPDKFGAGSGAGMGGGGMGAGNGIGMAALGDPSDPTSPAYFQQNIGDRVFFAVDQSTLSSDARAMLALQADWLGRNPSYSVVIEGHADEQGTREYNLALGARRANAAVEYLISQGVAAGRMRTVSYGKERPVEICSDEACYSRNRRAVTVITTGGNV